MKSSLLTQVIVLLLFAVSGLRAAAAPMIVVLGENRLEFRNTHRQNNPTLKITLNGGNVTRQEHDHDDRAYRFTMSDKTEIRFDEQNLSNKNSTEYLLEWSGAQSGSISREICFHVGHGGVHDSNYAKWYGTYETYHQHWPLDIGTRIGSATSFTTGNGDFASIIQGLFLNSDGFAVMLNLDGAWFVRRQPPSKPGAEALLCASVDENRYPYSSEHRSSNFSMQIRLLAGANIRDVHRTITIGSEESARWIPTPTGIPNEGMFTRPIWSTWAQYKKGITQTKVMQFTNEIHRRSLAANQIEIDDKWEKFYGDFTFDSGKFPNPKAMVDEIHRLGYRVTLWVYPFVNFDSPQFANNSAYFVHDHRTGKPAIAKWWDGTGAMIDFTNPNAADWFVRRLRKLQKDIGIDSFKFDAGESMSYFDVTIVPKFADEAVDHSPNLFTERYVKTCALLGDLIEVRSAFAVTEEPIFIRMLDKDSRWGVDNGLRSLITTALTMSIGGYHFVLPDMIGGNAYGGWPSAELYIRWLQANVFMPSLQFSITPWSFAANETDELVRVTKRFIDLHIQHSPLLIALAKRSAKYGEPIIRPMWYAAPDDPRTYTIDDQFMVGDDLLVAPIVVEHQRARKVYFPTGKWTDQHGNMYSGPAVAKVSAPLDELPHFMRRA